MPWPQIEASLAPLFARKARMGKSREDADMFGPTLVVAAGGVRRAGRPRLPIRPMVSLLYLKHAFNESDELVGWGEPANPNVSAGRLRWGSLRSPQPTKRLRYRRADTPSATYFFTLNAADRSGRLLTDLIDVLGDSFRTVRRSRSFEACSMRRGRAIRT